MLQRYFGNNKTILSVVTSFFMILAGLSACAGQATTPTFTNPNPIVIGASLSLTGNKNFDFSGDGPAMRQGYQLWADMVNNNGGLLGRPVKLIILDDNSDPNLVVKNYETLIKQDHVDLLFGPFSTLLTKAALDVPGISKYAFIEGAGGAYSVFQKAQQKGLNNLFDVSLPITNNLTTFVYYLLSLPAADRPTTAAYLTSDDPFTVPQVQLAETLLEQAGIKTVYTNAENSYINVNKNVPYPEGGNVKVATADAQQMIKQNPQVVILGSLLPDIQIVVPLFKQYHFNPKALIATAGPDLGQQFLDAIKGVKYAEGVFVPNGWYPQANTYQNAEMVSAYTGQYKVQAGQINGDVAEAFSVGQVLQQAASKINSIDNAALIKELQSSGDVFNTVQGTAQFDVRDGGQNTQAISYLFQWQGTQFIPVYPYSVAAENPTYPKPATY
ncbi:MAG TPA: amino acid ABC transporter substrate-binding protein [Ktedonobacteraceae bacterium]|nr:amino acid ABC transporter substrate-binding protein [Ktedonobacteraceae bacterium]